MKHFKKYLFFLILTLMIPQIGQAASCPILTSQNVSYFNASEYSSTNYCKTGESMQDNGCYPLSLATILDSYYHNVTPEAVGDKLCNDSTYNKDLVYSNMINDEKFQTDLKMKMRAINTLSDLDNALLANHMVLASINRGIFHHPNKNGEYSSGHYIVIALKNANGYYVLNTGARKDNNFYSAQDIENNVISKINSGMYEIIPTQCDSKTENEENSEVKFPDFGGNKTDCTNIFMKNNTELNDFGKFVQSVFTLMKIAAPVLVIILSTIDYMKAIASSNAEETKKATSRTIKRAVIGLIIFFLPFILDLIFHLFGLYDLSRCGIG